MDTKHYHNEIKEKLPEYILGTLTEEEKAVIRRHIQNCSECKEELDLIEKLGNVEVPDPGEMYWDTLAQKVKVLSGEKRKMNLPIKLFLRPVPATVLLCLITVFTGLFMYKYYFNGKYADPAFTDPLSLSSVDYSMIQDEDLTEISERLTIYLDNIDIFENTYYGDSYHKELSSLSSEEVNRLLHALKNQHNNGGV